MRAGNQEGFVLSIEGDWGSGKSFFLERLADDFDQKHAVALINAWESDSHGSPFLAILDTLDRALARYVDGPTINDKGKAIIRSAGKVATAAASALVRKSIARFLGESFSGTISNILDDAKAAELSNTLKNIGEATAEAVGEETVKQISKGIEALTDKGGLQQLAEYRSARRAKDLLHHSLKQIIDVIRQAEDAELPLFIMIDELDRCRPDYAVDMLEEIKHLFNIPGIVFILGMDRGQLAMAIEGAYGTHYQGERFLEKLIHFRYQLKEKPVDLLIKHALERDPPASEAFISDPFGRAIWQEISDVALMGGMKARQAERMLERFRAASYVTNRKISASLLAYTCAYAGQNLGSNAKYISDFVANTGRVIDGKNYIFPCHIEANKLSEYLRASWASSPLEGARILRSGHAEGIFSDIHSNFGWDENLTMGSQIEALLKSVAPFVPPPLSYKFEVGEGEVNLTIRHAGD